MFLFRSNCKIPTSAFEISDSEAGLKAEKFGAVVSGAGECGDTVVERVAKDRQSLELSNFYQ